MTIKDFVRKRLSDGDASLEAIWREAQERFTWQCCTWGYVKGVEREWKREQQSPKESV